MTSHFRTPWREEKSTSWLFSKLKKNENSKKKKKKKKDEPPKLHTDLPASMTQQLLERIVPYVSHITATCPVGFKKRGEQIPTDFVEVQLNDSIGKLHVTGSNFIEYRIEEEKTYEEQPPAKQSAFDLVMAASLIK